MNDQKNITLDQFSSHLFWDVDRSKMSIDSCRDFLVERVLLRGSRSDLGLLESVYKKAEINESIRKVGWMSEVDMAFVEVYFGIPKSELKCYAKRQLVHYC